MCYNNSGCFLTTFISTLVRCNEESKSILERIHLLIESEGIVVLTDERTIGITKVVEKVNSKEKMLEIIKKKQSGGKSNQTTTPKNDRKNMRKGPKIYNK